MNRYIALQKIIELNSFTKAADALGYTQSAISQMVASLEEEISIKLLNRSRVGVKLTLEGEALYPFIERSILQYRAMQEKSNEIRGLDTGIIRIGTISSVTCHWLPQLIKEFQNLYPNVQFVFHQGDYTSIQEWIKIGAVDFGFISPAAVTGLETHIVKVGRMLAILPQNHPLSSCKVIRLDEISNEPFILLEEGHYNEALDAFESFEIKPNIKYTLHDDYAIMTMVEAGLGISILAELVLPRTNYNIVIRPIDPPISRIVAIAYKDKNSLPIASKYFIDHLLSNVDKLA
ncbi:LysR family transcriptional regulator [Bacillus sp. dmp10]|uniref:LysR family transcriptional regulator n=1 Tax=Bacillus sp. dmp10 TaxID=2293321 RepID=UPI000E2E7639|nr:LysR family transcriptional regulator [Bacillus sp. dmp10]